MKILVTGSAGFIGSALCLKLLELNYSVVGIDNHNSYYSPKLKEDRVQRHKDHKNYEHIIGDITNNLLIQKIFDKNNFDVVINLAAQAGVRHSMEAPREYIDTNISGFLNILECSKENNIKHVIYASSSSVYGLNRKLPYSTNHSASHPVSLYATTKRANELMAHTYSHLYKLPTTGLRFFTVYGPWDRPDMALQRFTKSILAKEKIKLFNYGNHSRDFTFIDDIVEGIARIIENPAQKNQEWNANNPSENSSSIPWKLFNIGNTKVVKLDYLINLLEKLLDRKAEKELLPLQQGDVVDTHSDIDDFANYINYYPRVNIEEGLQKFIKWYTNYY